MLLLLLLAGYLPAYGQNSSISWDVGLEHGRIFKHSPKIAFPIPDRSYGIGLHMLFQTNGRKEWHQHHGYPMVGASLQYFDLGDPEVLGKAIAFYPNITLKLADRRRWMLHFRLGSGLSWVTRPYDRLTNPSNNSIGSRLNNATHFRLAAGFPLSERWAAFAGFSFTHFSNGAAQMPNLGINVPAVSASIRYTASPVKKAEQAFWDASRRPPRRLGGQAYLAMAYKESNPPGAAKWPVYKASVAGIYRISKVQNLLWGAEYEFQQSIYHFSLHTFTARSHREAREDASRWMLFLGNEWNFGNVGLLVQAGYYLSRRSSVLVPFPFYNKLGLRYYLPPTGRPATQFFASIYLKSHIITAEYISIGIGARVQ
jgi:hypothetical protein